MMTILKRRWHRHRTWLEDFRCRYFGLSSSLKPHSLRQNINRVPEADLIRCRGSARPEIVAECFVPTDWKALWLRAWN